MQTIAIGVAIMGVIAFLAWMLLYSAIYWAENVHVETADGREPFPFWQWFLLEGVATSTNRVISALLSLWRKPADQPA